ncbi:hypothetical protein [Legionella sp. km772]|uniref:hypothetical protein n=1 Tax=Legionella sp. km772 TaxID=2498111 RepID=UPI00131511BF|nr:hypothetical protein [Legionella sp. km772]
MQFIGNLHKTNPELFPILEKLLADPNQRAFVCNNIHYYKGNPSHFIQALVGQLLAHPDPSLLASLPIQTTAGALYSFGVHARSSNNLVMQAQLSSPTFIKVFFDNAVKEITALGYSHSAVKDQIERELMNCYLTGSLSEVKNLHFKNFLSAHIFNIAQACQVLPVSIQNSKMLDYFLTTTNAIKSDLLTKVAAINPAAIDSVFINDYFTRSLCANPKVLFEGLYRLNSTNPALAKYLTEIAQQQMDAFQPGSSAGFKNEVSRNGPAHLASWLTGENELQARVAAQAVIDRIAAQMNAMPVVFSDVNNRVAINRTASYLRTQAATILSAFEYQNAKQTLNLLSDPPEVYHAYMAKLEVINREYNRHLINCNQQEARAVIAKHIDDVQKFIPNTTGTAREMEESASRLRAMLNEPKYVEAKRTLGMTADPTEITQAFIEKSQAIDRAIAERINAEKPQFVQHIQEEVSASLHKANKKGPVELLKAFERFKDQYEDPYGDGLLNIKEKEKLFKELTPERVMKLAAKVQEIHLLKDDDLLKALEQAKAPLRKGVPISAEMAKLYEFLDVNVKPQVLSSKERIAHYVKDIEVLHVHFRDAGTKTEINARKEFLLAALNKLALKPEYASINDKAEVVAARQAKTEQINNMAEGLIKRLIAGYEAQIKTFPIQFSGNATNVQELHREARQLKHQLNDIVNKAIRDLGELPPSLQEARRQTEERIDAATKHEQLAFNKVEAAIDFKKHVAHHKHDLGTFERHLIEVEKMVKRVEVEHPAKYSHAKTLYDALITHVTHGQF